jgi:hypothetical protein
MDSCVTFQQVCAETVTECAAPFVLFSRGHLTPAAEDNADFGTASYRH